MSADLHRRTPGGVHTAGSVVRALCLALLLAAMPGSPAAAPAGDELTAPPASEVLRLRVSGISGELLANVQAALAPTERRQGAPLNAGKIRELQDQAELAIRRALEPFGHYLPQITSELSRPDQPGAPWRAHFRIQAGPPIPIGAVDIDLRGDGRDDSALATLPAAVSLRAAATLDHSRYESAKRALLDQLRERGYLEARYLHHRVRVELARYRADIQLRIETGPRYVFGAVTFDQQRFAPEYLARYLVLEPGLPYSQAAITRQRTVLGRSGHFREVAIELGEAVDSNPPAIPVSIRLVPYLANRYRGRVGWGSDTGIGLQLDWTRRHLGRHGHHFNLGGTVVEERNRVAADLRYTIPMQPLEGQHIELGARHESKDLTYEDVDLDEGGETRIATNLVSAQWRLPEVRLGDFEIQQRVGLSLVGESYDVFEVLFGNLPREAQDAIIGSIGNRAYETLAPEFEAVVPGAGIALRRADNPLYIRRGDYVNLDLFGSDESLGSNISFWQARLATWSIRPVGERGRLLVRSALGFSDAESREVLGVNFNQMPEFFEFRAGGARSVRGYGYETLFPSDAITGGKHQLVASLEYEHEIIPDWGAAIFLDGGNAFNDFDDIDPKLGIGLGVRWRSPVGMARVDLGFPLDDADDAFQVYITVGPEF